MDISKIEKGDYILAKVFVEDFQSGLFQVEGAVTPKDIFAHFPAKQDLCTCDIDNKGEGFVGVTNNLQCPVHKPNPHSQQDRIKRLDLSNLVVCDYGDTDKIISYIIDLGIKINELIAHNNQGRK